MQDIVPGTREFIAADPSADEGPKPIYPVENSLIPQKKIIPSEPAMRQLTDEERVDNYVREQQGFAKKADVIAQAGLRTSMPELKDFIKKPKASTLQSTTAEEITPPTVGMIEAPTIPPVPVAAPFIPAPSSAKTEDGIRVTPRSAAVIKNSGPQVRKSLLDKLLRR